MASAAASRPPAPPPPPPPPPAQAQALQWLGPRVSFSLDDAAAGREAAGGKPGASSADFEFLLGCSAVSMLPADELFSGGKLVPLRVPAANASVEEEGSGAGEAPTKQGPTETPRADEEAGEKGVAAAVDEEPKIPARRWRDLLRLRKQQQASSSSSEPRPLRRFLRRGPKPPEPEPSLSLPLLRELPNPDEKSTTPAAAAAATPTPTSAPLPTPQQHRNLPPKIRLSPSPPPPPPPPPPPAAVAADSPRLNAAGKVVFNGLGRSSSSPSSLASGGRRTHHRGGGGGAIERSYSAHVRVAPVLNVPVCSLRGSSRKSVSVFGIDRLFSSSSSASAFANPAGGGGKKAKATKKVVVTAAAATQ